MEGWAAFEPDLSVSRSAFQTLTALVHHVLNWLLFTARFPTASLATLLRHLSENDAWKKYGRGEHAAGWAGVELARLYKKIKAELTSRSKRSVNPLRDLRYGFKVGKSDWPPNNWFRREYESKHDYRPTGKMAVWIARKIEEIRQVKRRQSECRLFASIIGLQSDTEDILPASVQSKIVRGTSALKRLYDLPHFGEPKPEAIKVWQAFVRYQVLTQKQIVTEFESLFPKERKKLDGVITATLRSAWRASQCGGDVILPEY